MDSLFINYFSQGAALSPLISALIGLIFLWSVIWKGIALWHAVESNEKIWFIALLLINSVAILEIAYLFYFSKNKITLGQAQKFVKTLSFKKIKTLLST